ncbi:unnamed protein product [Brachionus calyciflorus]|uniref:SHSP domain-containing protein n=1 Tax=Brachionus calyciflorus TaxID=104777 RepID=A0A813Y219_9BILA|nr:unnamed protein product [Brachionus calyciflorus]
MSLLKHQYFPRSMFETHWPAEGQTTDPLMLDMFDPFDELDRSLAKNFMWINRPQFLSEIPEMPKVPHKFRVTLDCLGFDTKSIKTEFNKDKTKLVVKGGSGRVDLGDGDFIHKEFKRTYDVPLNTETDKLVSFVTSTGKLVIEMPLKMEQKKGVKAKQELIPKIVEDDKGNKTVQLNVLLPHAVDPSNVKVTCKDNDVIIRADQTKETNDEYSRVHIYKRCKLPENTDYDDLKCVMEKDQLTITAPLEPGHNLGKRTIPIEFHESTKKIKNN